MNDFTSTIDPNTVIEIVDKHTHSVIATSTYANIKRFRNRAHKLDAQYGACRYTVKIHFVD